MFTLTIHHMMIALFSAFLLVAAYQDVRAYRIPNMIIMALLILYPVHFFTSPFEIAVLWSLGIAVTFFLIGVGLFSAGIMGGGDVKLIAVTSLWVGIDGLIPFMIAMALVGGVMSVFMMSTPARSTTAHLCGHLGLYGVQEKIMTDKLPYGVAICAGGLYAAFTVYVG